MAATTLCRLGDNWYRSASCQSDNAAASCLLDFASFLMKHWISAWPPPGPLFSMSLIRSQQMLAGVWHILSSQRQCVCEQEDLPVFAQCVWQWTVCDCVSNSVCDCGQHKDWLALRMLFANQQRLQCLFFHPQIFVIVTLVSSDPRERAGWWVRWTLSLPPTPFKRPPHCCNAPVSGASHFTLHYTTLLYYHLAWVTIKTFQNAHALAHTITFFWCDYYIEFSSSCYISTF